MADRFNIDAHKLVYHPRRTADLLEAGDDWERAKSVYPLYVEISPSGACNHRCSFCAVDYVGYQTAFLNGEMMAERLPEMGRLGVKSMLCSGEGEPLLHKGINGLINNATNAEIDMAVATNGVNLNQRFIDASLPRLTWMKISLNAGTAATYAKVHGTKAKDFDRVIGNLEAAARHKREKGLACVIGAQSLLLPENAGEMAALARTCREIGLDYLVVKPYSQHLASDTRTYEKIDYGDYLHLEEALARESRDHFNVVFRAHTMKKHDIGNEGRYPVCLSTPLLWAHVMTDGKVYSCTAFLNDERFYLGNLNNESFQAIWEGERRRENFEFVRHHLDISACRVNCRMDEINRYLFDLRADRIPHVNFI